MFGRLFSKENVKNALLKTLQGAVILAAPYFARSYLEKMEQSEKQEVKKEIRANESKPAEAQTDDVKGSLKTPKTNVRSDITGTVSKKVQQKVLKQKAHNFPSKQSLPQFYSLFGIIFDHFLKNIY